LPLFARALLLSGKNKMKKIFRKKKRPEVVDLKKMVFIVV
jgi:hypothetical protein